MAHDDSDTTVFFCFPVTTEPACRAGETTSAPTCGKGRHRRLKPTGLATDMHAVTCGFDSRNRLSSDTDKRDGYMPPLVSGFAVRRQHAGQGAHHHRRSRHTTVHMVAVPHRRHLRRRNGLPIVRRTRLRSSVGQIKCRPLVQAQPQALGASFLFSSHLAFWNDAPFRRDSSVGQSGRLVSRGSRVRIPFAARSRMRRR